MSTTIRKIYRNKLDISNQPIDKGSEYHTKSRQLIEYEQKLFEILPEEFKETVRKFLEINTEQSDLYNEEVFVKGFKLGMSLAKESQI